MRPSHRSRNPMWVGGPKAYRHSPCTAVSTTDILKELYPQHSLFGGPVMERSWAAKLARERHWITWEEYFAFPLEPTGAVAKQRRGELYDLPLFGLLKKEVPESWL